jgi:dTDP-4-dehydrorhamnose 3,5-epimerase
VFNSRIERDQVLMKQLAVEEIHGVLTSKQSFFSDQRGSFLRLDASNNRELVYSAISSNPILGTIRGLHMQLEPYSESKEVICLEGKILEILLDLRPNSETCGRWGSIVLDSRDSLQISIPKGVAHGFQTLEANTVLHYTIDAPYVPESAISIDPFGDLDIDWPIKDWVISEKDSSGINLVEALRVYRESLIL